jgi:hypothetical protein
VVKKYRSNWVERSIFYREEKGEINGAPAPHFKLYERPVIVCLCGSTRFKDTFETAQRNETLAGKIVLTVGMFVHLEGIDMSGPVKQMLDSLHIHKIDLADEVLVLNVNGYVGDSTRREVLYALKKDKIIRWIEPYSVPDDLKSLPAVENSEERSIPEDG